MDVDVVEEASTLAPNSELATSHVTKYFSVRARTCGPAFCCQVQLGSLSQTTTSKNKNKLAHSYWICMRIRLSSNAGDNQLKAWFLLDENAVSTIQQLKASLCHDVGFIQRLQCTPKSIELFLEDFELLDDTLVQILREGDLLRCASRFMLHFLNLTWDSIRIKPLAESLKRKEEGVFRAYSLFCKFL